MARVLLTVRVAASLWHLFQLALFQERLTMQRWVERAVSRTLRGERRAKEGSRWKGKVGRTENRGPVKQIVARLEKDQLTGLQTICRAEGIPLKA